MKMTARILGVVATLLVAAPVAVAHELACEKTVNGKAYIEASTFPMTLEYSLTVKNVHPEAASEVLGAHDALLAGQGFAGFDTPFTLPFESSETKTFEVKFNDYLECLAFAALDGTVDDFIDNTFTVRWDAGSELCSARVKCVAPGQEEEPPGEEEPPPETPILGRMTGGGSVFTADGRRVTHGFQLRCDADDARQNLQVNFQRNRFHLLDLTTASCTDTELEEAPPVAGFDTFTATGTGRYNGVEGATIEFTFTDDGEPGVDDTAKIVIRDAGGTVVLDVATNELTFGNHQAHRTTP